MAAKRETGQSENDEMRWVRVSDSIPEEGSCVVVWIPDGEGWLSAMWGRFGDVDQWLTDVGDPLGAIPSHWMSISAPSESSPAQHPPNVAEGEEDDGLDYDYGGHPHCQV